MGGAGGGRPVARPARGEPDRRLRRHLATVWGLGRAVFAERPDLRGALVDLDSQPSPGEAGRLLDERLRGDGEDQVAFRGGARLVARLRRAPPGLAETQDELALRPDATYLVTGGTGGLGLFVARWMVGRGARSLALLARHPSAVIESFVRVRMDRLMGAGSGDPREVAEQVWTRSHEEALDFFDSIGPGRTHVLRYEELVRDPAVVMGGGGYVKAPTSIGPGRAEAVRLEARRIRGRHGDPYVHIELRSATRTFPTGIYELFPVGIPLVNAERGTEKTSAAPVSASRRRTHAWMLPLEVGVQLRRATGRAG